MNRILSSLKDKRFRYGSFSTVMILFAVVIFVLVNMVAGQLNVTKDLTSDQMYSLSKYSKEFLAGLEQDVTIYALYKTGQENLMVKQLLDEYASQSPHVTVEYRDPVLYPTFVDQYAKPDEAISDGSVIVTSGSKFKTVLYEEMYSQEFDYNTFNYYVSSIDIEPKISNAINYVISGESPIIYRVVGNNEYDLPEALVSQIEMANYELRDANLLTGEVPEDCDMLLITPPGRDWSTDEADRILNYLQADGRAMVILGFMTERFPNLDNVLAAYGVRIGDYFVVEGSADNYYLNTPTAAVPNYIANDITQPLIDKRYPSLMVQSGAVEELSLKKTSTTFEPFLITSNASYGKTNPNAETINKEPGDIDGPFTLGAMITDSFYTDVQHTTKMVIFGCELILESYFNDVIGGTNWDLMVNSANWLVDQSTSIYIPSKSPSSSTQLAMTQGQAGMVALLSVAVLPLIIIGTGLTVWFRRRHS